MRFERSGSAPQTLLSWAMKRSSVETLAKELLVKEVLFQSDVETLIGKRPFEDRRHEEDKEEEETEGILRVCTP